MSDWDFLHEMRERGYSAKEIDEAAGCGVAPWEWAQIEEREGNCNRDLGKIRDAGSATREGSKGRRIRPSKEQIAQLPPFVGLALDRIFVVRTMSQLKVASDAIHSERFVGFDTESRPTWTEDAPRTGPHVIQLALSDRAYIFQKPLGVLVEPLRSIIESEYVVKVGFGLDSDRGLLRRNLGFRLKNTVELSQALRVLRYKQKLGAKAAVAIVLGRELRKSKSTTTSDWAKPGLSARQLKYAADDAFAALTVFRAIGSPYSFDVLGHAGDTKVPAPGGVAMATRMERV